MAVGKLEDGPEEAGKQAPARKKREVEQNVCVVVAAGRDREGG
jgi:hypothetical protein